MVIVHYGFRSFFHALNELSFRAPGILTGDETLARNCIAQGCLFVAVVADQNLLRDSAQALASRFKN